MALARTKATQPCCDPPCTPRWHSLLLWQPTAESPLLRSSSSGPTLTGDACEAGQTQREEGSAWVRMGAHGERGQPLGKPTWRGHELKSAGSYGAE
eukprot:5516827-Prymnesium_polylepis.2